MPPAPPRRLMPRAAEPSAGRAQQGGGAWGLFSARRWRARAAGSARGRSVYMRVGPAAPVPPLNEKGTRGVRSFAEGWGTAPVQGPAASATAADESRRQSMFSPPTSRRPVQPVQQERLSGLRWGALPAPRQPPGPAAEQPAAATSAHKLPGPPLHRGPRGGRSLASLSAPPAFGGPNNRTRFQAGPLRLTAESRAMRAPLPLWQSLLLASLLSLRRERFRAGR